MPTAPIPMYTLCRYPNRDGYFILRKDGARADFSAQYIQTIRRVHTSVDLFLNSEYFIPSDWGIYFKPIGRRLNLPEWF